MISSILFIYLHFILFFCFHSKNKIDRLQQTRQKKTTLRNFFYFSSSLVSFFHDYFFMRNFG